MATFNAYGNTIIVLVISTIVVIIIHSILMVSILVINMTFGVNLIIITVIIMIVMVIIITSEGLLRDLNTLLFCHVLAWQA